MTGEFCCPGCGTDLIIPRPEHATPKLTLEQRMYTWLFDLLLDPRVGRREKMRARDVMRRLVPVPSRSRPVQRVERLPVLGDLIRETLRERLA